MLSSHLTTDQCAAELMNIIPLVIRFLRAEMRYHGEPLLSLSQLRVLTYLKRYPHASLSEVAEYLDVTRPTMSAMIERLVQRAWVDRTDDPQERRRVILSLTPLGMLQLQQVSDATRARVAERLTTLSDAQLRQLMDGLLLLGLAFEDAKGL